MALEKVTSKPNRWELYQSRSSIKVIIYSCAFFKPTPIWKISLAYSNKTLLAIRPDLFTVLYSVGADGLRAISDRKNSTNPKFI